MHVTCLTCEFTYSYTPCGGSILYTNHCMLWMQPAAYEQATNHNLLCWRHAIIELSHYSPPHSRTAKRNDDHHKTSAFASCVYSEDFSFLSFSLWLRSKPKMIGVHRETEREVCEDLRLWYRVEARIAIGGWQGQNLIEPTQWTFSLHTFVW